MEHVEELRAALTGPVASFRTPFRKNGEIDWRGVQESVEFDIAAGSRSIILTAGDIPVPICQSAQTPSSRRRA